MKARLLILVLLCIFLFCCGPVDPRLLDKRPKRSERALSDVEKGYLEKAMSTPLTFSVPNEKAEIVWGRVQSFIGNYSPLRIQVATNYVVQTYSGNFCYYATRTPGETETEFSVKCLTDLGVIHTSDRNAHILAYYALTGELMPQLIKR